jgi:hypothetical protein
VRVRIAVVLLAAAAALLPVPEPIVERVYSNGIFVLWQRAATVFSNAVPFALFDALVVALTAAWIALAVRDLVRRRLRALLPIAWRTVVWASVVYVAFLAAWGLNYQRVALEEKIGVDRRLVTADAARALARTVVAGANAEYAPAQAAGWPARGVVDPALRGGFAAALEDLGASPRVVPGRPKTSVFDLYFRRAVVDGMTDPFFLETLVASDLNPFERPFVVAHEWAHLAGYADEGEANLIGWLACMRGNAADRYSAWLFLYQEVGQTLPRADRLEDAGALADGPRRDLRAIAARVERNASPRVAQAGWQVYNQYLKANGVEAGAASYTEVVKLLLGSRFSPIRGASRP